MTPVKHESPSCLVGMTLHTHTHTHFTHQMAPGSRNHSHWEIHQSATYLLLQTILPKKHHPTPSNEIQRNSAGEHWINRSPHKWQPATTIITAGKIPTAPSGTVRPQRLLIGASTSLLLGSYNAETASPISKQISDNRCVDYIQSRSIPFHN